MNALVDIRTDLSIMTKIKVLGFNEAAGDAIILSIIMKDAVIIQLTAEIVDETIAIRKACKFKVPDAIIAATAALVNHITLVIRNTSDFVMLNGLQLVNLFFAVANEN